MLGLRCGKYLQCKFSLICCSGTAVYSDVHQHPNLALICQGHTTVPKINPYLSRRVDERGLYLWSVILHSSLQLSP